MPTKFGTNFPAVRKGRQKEKFLLVLIGFAGVFLLIFVLLLVNLLKSKGGDSSASGTQAQPAAQTEVVAVTLYTPVRNIKEGTSLDNVRFREVYWNRNNVPEGAVFDRSEVQGKFAANEIKTGLPITRSDLTNEKQFVTLPITPGMRAVAIEVDSTSGIEGWARPGSRVDVVLTHKNQGELTSIVLVENARVLSAGGEASNPMQASGKMSRVKLVRTITLEVAPKDALEIQTSKKMGSLSLLMRSSNDDKAVETTEVSSGDVNQGTGGRKANRMPAGCTPRGTMRIGGKEYLIGCDGKLEQLIDEGR